MELELLPFRQVWLVGFGFHQPPGENQEPQCVVAHELRSDRKIAASASELLNLEAAFSFGNDTLLVTYNAAEILGCFLALGLSMPARILDLNVEFRCLTNGLALPSGDSLFGATVYYNLPSSEIMVRQASRALSQNHKRLDPHSLMQSAEIDVRAIRNLLPKMVREIDLPRALLRGRYMAAAARMEQNGVPIDAPLLTRFRTGWGNLKRSLVRTVDPHGEIYDGASFSAKRFSDYVSKKAFPWPRLTSGALALDDDTFRMMSRRYPEIAPYRELRYTLNSLRLESLSVGQDGRNRCPFNPFRSSTGRNQPSSSQFIFGPSCWLRGLIKPDEGTTLAYVDWEQQEFGIAAALSDDSAMKDAYISGDPYLTFAKQAGAVPPEGIVSLYREIRERFKICALAVQYGMSSRTLGEHLGQNEAEGRRLLELHRTTYPQFWAWSQSAVDFYMLMGWIETVFGWQLHISASPGTPTNLRSIANFPMQANGAEMLRLACCLATERGVKVCAPIHDALLIESKTEDAAKAVATTQACMAEASRIVLSGFELRTDVMLVSHPDRYMDPRGESIWKSIMNVLQES